MPVFKHLTIFAAVFLVLYGVFPVMVSAAYGGNPPPHIARLLDKQMEVFAAIAPIVFTPFKLFASRSGSFPQDSEWALHRNV
jgi:hypothetical protein